MFRLLVKTALPLGGFAAGFLLLPAEWRKSRIRDRKINSINTSVVEELSKTSEFQKLLRDEKYTQIFQSETVLQQHQKNFVSHGLLFGPNLMEIDPIIFLDEKKGELSSFYHIGSKLVSSDGLVHNGVTSTIIDEGLCTCGFSRLPNKRGVTARLSIEYKNQAPPNSTVILRAKVVESKGRKVVIDGVLETFPLDGGSPIEIARANCVLVEPKWFKYVSWFQLF